MACIIFGDAFTFPDGDASTNRVYAYAKGLHENGMKVSVVCFRNSYLTIPSGISEGIEYYHPFERRARSKSFFQRRFDSINKYLNTYFLFLEMRRKEEIFFILCYTKAVRTQILAFLLSRITGSKLILERSEHPFKDYTCNFAKVVLGSLKIFLEIRFTDYIFCISDYLIEFYKERGAREHLLLKVPSIVDNSRFSKTYTRPVKARYVCYTGSLTKQKDGVHILIISFSLIADKHKDISLFLVGRADTLEEEIYFRDLVADLGITDRVVFTGKIPRIQIPPYVCNAEALVLARPKSMVADAGFPSKLTEYLSSGKPVVVTRVGEIPRYLTNNYNAFLAEPDSSEAFADRLDYVLTHRKVAQEVGIKARELALSIFDSKYQAQQILSFIESNLRK